MAQGSRSGVTAPMGAWVSVKGLSMRVSSVRVADRDGIGRNTLRVAADIEVRASGDRVGTVPMVELACGDARDLGTYYADSSVVPGRVLQPGGRVEGRVVLGMPRDALPDSCASPRLLVTPPGSTPLVYEVRLAT
jgi:hypothetical protein